MKPALFCIEAYATPVIGLQTGKRWNGWHVPLFPMASCEAVALACPDEDGNVHFRFDPVTRCWIEAPAPGCEEDGDWPSEPVLVDGVEYWAMGGGYCWDEVGLCADGERAFFRDGKEDVRPDLWPLPVQAFLLGELWVHGHSASFHFDGINYSFAR